MLWPARALRYWVKINRLLVPFGKHICTGTLPRCSTCPVLEDVEDVLGPLQIAESVLPEIPEGHGRILPLDGHLCAAPLPLRVLR